MTPTFSSRMHRSQSSRVKMFPLAMTGIWRLQRPVWFGSNQPVRCCALFVHEDARGRLKLRTGSFDHLAYRTVFSTSERRESCKSQELSSSRGGLDDRFNEFPFVLEVRAVMSLLGNVLWASKLTSTASHWSSTNLAALSIVSGLSPQNWTIKGRSPDS